MNRLLFLGVLLSLVFAPAIWAQTPGTGNVAGTEFDLSTQVGASALDNTDKNVNLLQTATISVTSPDASLVGTPVIVAAGLAPGGSDPVSDFGSEIGIIGLPLSGFVVIVDGVSTAPLGAVIGANGLNFGLTLPCLDLAAAGLDGVYFQSTAPDATKPNGFVFSVATELTAQTQLVTSFSDTINDDDNELYTLCLTTVDFYGVTYSEFYVGSNGFVTFGAGDNQFAATESSLLADEPRVCGLWGDLSPDDGGSLTVTETTNGAIVSFDQVPSFMSTFSGLGGGLNTFAMELTTGGHVTLTYGPDVLPDAPNSNNDEIVGISAGGGLSLANEIDLSSGIAFSLADQALYEVYDDVCGDTAEELANATLTFTYLGANDYQYNGSGFTTPPASFDSIAPTSGSDAGGDAVTINGCNFDMGNTYTVDFGANNVSATFVDFQTLTCVSPAGTGTVDVTLNENGSPVDTLTGAFTYITPPALGPADTTCPAGAVQWAGQGDDNFFVQTLTFGFDFYGVTYTEITVGSNGYLELGNTSANDFSESVSDLTDDAPKICLIWDDLSPQNSVSMQGIFTDDDGSTFTVCYVDVPEFSTSGGTGSNTAIVRLTGAAPATLTLPEGLPSGGTVIMDFDGANTIADFLCGVSPGEDMAMMPAASNAIDLSTGGNAIPVGEAAYEVFTSSSVKDVNGFRVVWSLDGAGNPVSQN